MKRDTIYFPGLAGLRAICAIAVVFSHTSGELKLWGLDNFIFGARKDGTPKGLSLAGFGVTIFFVLSGFLITYLLQEEKEKGEINIKKFYLRRLLRIWPLYYLYLAVAVSIILIYNIDTQLNLLPFYIFFMGNIPMTINLGMKLVGHYWSLGVEEQFYLFWPLINKWGKNLFSISFCTFVFLVSLKLILHFIKPHTIIEDAINISGFDCMLIGGMGALLLKRNEPLFIKFANNKITQCSCWVIIFLAAINKYHVASIVDNEIISMVALLIIIGQIKIKNRIVNLERPVFIYLGKISYGIYIIHNAAIFLLSKYLVVGSLPAPFNYIVVFSLTLLITITLAHLSYKYYESYFLKLKHKFTVIDSSSIPELNHTQLKTQPWQ